MGYWRYVTERGASEMAVYETTATLSSAELRFKRLLIFP